MGLAASQARFLGITLRKANCEFKSTELAQQRLELTNQMADISQEYANALNATKLVWHNEAVCDSFGNPMNYGISYSLLMMPSAANDFDPYMVTSKSGAIVLNSKYAAAAKAAGISMAGGVPSEAGRNKFIASLANAKFENGEIKKENGKIVYDTEKHDNIITSTTCDILNKISAPTAGADVKWYASSGLGATPKNKSIAGGASLKDLLLDENIGQRPLDWLQIYRAAQGFSINNAITENQYYQQKQLLTENLSIAKLNYINEGKVDADTASSVANDKTHYAEFTALETKIANAKDATDRNKYIAQLENLKRGLDDSGNSIEKDDSNKYKYPIYWAAYELKKLNDTKDSNCISWIDDATKNDSTHVSISTLFQTNKQEVSGGNYYSKLFDTPRAEDWQKQFNTLTLVINDVIKKDAAEIKNLTVADLMKNDVVLIARNNNNVKSVSVAAQAMLEYVAGLLGYGSIGKGLNVDETANSAMEMAMAATIKKVLNPTNIVSNGGSENDSSMKNSDAYKNALNYNRIGSDYSNVYAAISLSNVVSSFLTYFDNYLRGLDSGYVVGKSNIDGKTNFVTDDPSYVYVMSSEDALSNDEKIADFYNELYNNICDKGWRPDEMVNDSGYLESAIKDGRYQLMALNNDGYFYQMRYNDLPYLVEEQDEDAITRAEAAFTTKKAQITFKEDEIDIKTKKLDAEITELNTEINSVQNIISKSIEKTFSMFSN